MKEEKRKKKDKTFNVWVIIGSLFGLTLILFRKVLSPNVLIFASDQIAAGFAFREFEREILRQFHHFPLWDPYIFSGIPFIDAFHGDIFYLTAFARILFPTHIVMNWHFLLHIFLAGVFMYLYLSEFQLDRKLKFLLSVGYMFTGYGAGYVYSGHDSKVAIFALTPLIFWGVMRGMRTLKLYYAFLTAVIMGLGLLAPHVQLMYYLYMAISFLFLFEIIHKFFKEKDIKAGINLAIQYLIILIVSFSIGAIQLYPGYLYTSKFSPRAHGHRGYDFAISWSMPWEDYISAFFARFSNFMSDYWGRAPFKINTEYMGGIGLFLLVIAIITKTYRQRKGIYFWFLFILFTLISLGGYTPIYKLFYAILPGIKKFRAPSMSFLLVVFSVFTLGAMGMEKGNEGKEKELKVISKVGYAVIGIGLVLLIFKSMFLKLIPSLFHTPAMKLNVFYANYKFIPLGFFRTGIVILALYYLLYKVKLESFKEYAPFVAAMLVYFDLFEIDNRFIQVVKNFQWLYAPDKVVEFLKTDSDIYRVFPIFYKIDENYLMLHHIESIGGHHGNQFQRYQEYVGNPKHFMFRPNEVPYLLKYPYLVDLLNVKYVITQPIPKDLSKYNLDPMTYKLLSQISRFLNDTTHFKLIKLVPDNNQVEVMYGIYENRRFIKRVFFRTRYVVKNKEDALKYMLAPDKFKPYQEVVLEEQPSFELNDTGKVQVNSLKIEYKSPSHVVIDYETDKPSIMVYSGNYYIRWKAFLDGRPEKIYRANYIMMGMYAPAGKHRIELVYDSRLYNHLGILAVLSSIISLGIFFIGYRHEKLGQKSS